MRSAPSSVAMLNERSIEERDRLERLLVSCHCAKSAKLMPVISRFHFGAVSLM